MFNTYNELLDDVVKEKHSYIGSDYYSFDRLPIVTKDNKNLRQGLFKTNLTFGNRWEDTILYNLEDKWDILDIEKNDDRKFDIQHSYEVKNEVKNDSSYVRLEVKYQTNKYGNLMVVTYEREKHKGWVEGTSDIYVGVYIVEDIIYHLYIKVTNLLNYLDDDNVWGTKGKWFINYKDNTQFWGYKIPFEDFRDKCDFIDTRQMSDDDITFYIKHN